MMKQIPGYEAYAACEDGRIFSHKTGKFLTPTPNHKGYLRVQLSKDGVSTGYSVHSLILITFVGERPEGKVARHLNGKKSDNARSNLEWGTPKENEADKLTHGTRICGERHPKSCISDADVAEIRLAKARGGEHWNSNALAERFGVKQDTIQKIASGRRRNSIALVQRERQQGSGHDR